MIQKFGLYMTKFAVIVSPIAAALLIGLGVVLAIYPQVLFTLCRIFGIAFCLFGISAIIIALAACMYIGRRESKQTTKKEL